jgi:DNA-binding transcriptional LysR family regulator
VRIGSVPSAVRALLAPIAAALQAERARIVLHIDESYLPETLFERLARGELDAVFAPVVGPVPGVDAEELIRDSYVLLVPAGDRLARVGRPVLATDLRGRRLIAKDCSTPSHRALEAALARLEVETETVARVHDGVTVQELVAAGVGISVIPRLLADPTDPRVALLPIDHLLPDRVLGLYLRRGVEPSGPVARVAELARDCAR